MKTPPNDYLKFWRIIRYYIKSKHGLTTADLDMILFLSSEGYFKRSQFAAYNQVLSWDVKRFERLQKEGWIEIFRERWRKRNAMFSLSYKATRLVLDVYKLLSGKEIPMHISKNTMFYKNVCYNDKVYRNMIKQMNDYLREKKLTAQQERLAQKL